MQEITLPTFNHSEVNILLQHDLSIPHELVKPLFELPRATLIEDMYTILRHAVEKQAQYAEKPESDKYDDFVLPALWILSDLKAEEALPDVLDFLKNDRNIIDFWLGDFITEDLWEVIYAIGQNDYDLLKSFVLDKNIDPFVRSAASTAVAQTANHIPEKKEQVTKWFDDLLDVYLTNPEEFSKYEEWEIITIVVNDIIDFKPESLLPKVEKLHKLELIDESYAGNWKNYQDLFFNKTYNLKRELHGDIFAKYSDALDTWHYYRVKYDKAYSEKNTYKPYPLPVNKPVRTGKKIGRNDPCPCGSGKKYKKCCL